MRLVGLVICLTTDLASRHAATKLGSDGERPDEA
jgi:hypothetical protein